MTYPTPPRPAQVSRYTIPSGDPGTWATLEKMTEAARRGAADPRLPSGTPAELGRWIGARWVFHPDPLGVELVRAPGIHLDAIEREGRALGDCDDAATLAAAATLAQDYPTRFVVVAWSPGDFQHVFVEARDPSSGRWIELDPTRPDQVPTGLEPIRRAEWRL